MLPYYNFLSPRKKSTFTNFGPNESMDIDIDRVL